VGRTPEVQRVLATRAPWRQEVYRIIFEHDTPAGKGFDVLLIAAILLSVAAVMLESVAEIRMRHGQTLRTAEWLFTFVFTIEYGLRLATAISVKRYARSFYGVIDLLAVLPTYIGFVIPGGQAFAVIRILRVLRVFRVLKLTQFVGSERLLLQALRSSSYKIVVFLFAVLSSVVIIGSFMHFVEGADSGFSSIPRSVYWAIVTVTTVGYGDIAPQTPIGQMLAAFLMILGYGIIAVPTGIVTVEMASQRGGLLDLAAGRGQPERLCVSCASSGHDADAAHCKYCGAAL
jgi:voltage-gated potassium channel